MTPNVKVLSLQPGDEHAVLAASHLFDDPARPDQTRRFLAEPGHHLLLAYVEGEPGGFASGVEIVHPDKAPELMLYEIAVDERLRRHGIGRTLVTRLRELARERGCASVFVFAEREDDDAQAFYNALAPDSREGSVMYTYDTAG